LSVRPNPNHPEKYGTPVVILVYGGFERGYRHRRNLFLVKNIKERSGTAITSVIKNSPVVQVPASLAKKARTAKKKSSKGIFGLLPDWKIDTQELKDELRN